MVQGSGQFYRRMGGVPNSRFSSEQSVRGFSSTLEADNSIISVDDCGARSNFCVLCIYKCHAKTDQENGSVAAFRIPILAVLGEIHV